MFYLLWEDARRSCRAQLRCAIVPLQTDKGWWINKNEEARRFTYNVGLVESGKNVFNVFNCNYYNTKRLEFFPELTNLSADEKLQLWSKNVGVCIFWNIWNSCTTLNMVPIYFKPIPKHSTSDPRLPIQYDGIALLWTTYKLYASVLNHRTVK
jgi:hypothetical protein